MKRYDQIIKQLNRLLSLLKIDFRFEKVFNSDDSSLCIVIHYQGFDDHRRYLLTCNRGLALKRIYPQF